MKGSDDGSNTLLFALTPKTNSKHFSTSRIDPTKIRVVIPVYKDWEGLKITLDSLRALRPRPGAITIANDNDDNHIPKWLKSYTIRIVNYRGNQGPAYARNKGAGNVENNFEWIYFTDCGCEHTRDILM